MEREVSEVDRKVLLRKSYLDKIEDYKSGAFLGQDELYTFVRKFFGEYLKLDYEFTYEELSLELNKVLIRPKVKDHIDDFLIRLSESEYLEENSLAPEQISSFLDELAQIIQDVIYDEESAPVPETLIGKLLKSGHHAINPLIPTTLSHIHVMMDKVSGHIRNGNIDLAKSSYVELLNSYDTLSKEDKEPLHKQVNLLYDNLQALINKSNVSQGPAWQNARSAAAVSSRVVDSSNMMMNAIMVEGLVKKASEVIDSGDVDDAKRSYARALKAYESLAASDRKSLYPLITRLYSDLQALSSPKLANVGADSAAAKSAIPAASQLLKQGNTLQVATAASAATATSADVSLMSIPSTSKGADIDNLKIIESSSGNQLLNTQPSSGQEQKYDQIPAKASVMDYAKDHTSSIKGTGKASSSKSATIEPSIPLPSLPSKASPESSSITLESEGNTLFTYGALQSNPTMDDAKNTRTSDSNNDLNAAVNAKKSLSSSDGGNLLLNLGNSQDPRSNTSDTRSDNISKAPAINNIPQSSTTKVTADTRPSIANISKSKISAITPAIKDEVAAPKNPINNPININNPVNNTAKTSPVLKHESTIMHSNADDIPAINDLEIIAEPSNAANTILPAKPENIGLSRDTPKGHSLYYLGTDINADIHADKQRAPVSMDGFRRFEALVDSIRKQILSEDLEAAKTTYAKALELYRTMDDATKSRSYNDMHDTFTRLDEALHKKSLHELLEVHLASHDVMQQESSSQESISLVSQGNVAKNIGDTNSDDTSTAAKMMKTASTIRRPLHAKRNAAGTAIADTRGDNQLLLSRDNSNSGSLPVTLANDVAESRVYELIEESYFNISQGNADLSKLKYFKALELYRQLSMTDKKQLYPAIYGLFRMISKMSSGQHGMIIRAA